MNVSASTLTHCVSLSVCFQNDLSSFSNAGIMITGVPVKSIIQIERWAQEPGTFQWMQSSV